MTEIFIKTLSVPEGPRGLCFLGDFLNGVVGVEPLECRFSPKIDLLKKHRVNNQI